MEWSKSPNKNSGQIACFPSQAFHLRHQLPPHPEHDADSLDETVEPAEESKEDEETGAKKAVAKKQELETEVSLSIGKWVKLFAPTLEGQQKTRYWVDQCATFYYNNLTSAKTI